MQVHALQEGGVKVLDIVIHGVLLHFLEELYNILRGLAVRLADTGSLTMWLIDIPCLTVGLIDTFCLAMRLAGTVYCPV